MKAEFLDKMGNDLTVVNAARVSFGTESTELSDKDIGLINFLARGCMKKDWNERITQAYLAGANHEEDAGDQIESVIKWAKNMPTHWTPFSHCMITLRETVPIFVARQRFKHMVGFTYNEISRRYVDDKPEFHFPGDEGWRERPVGGIKQGSAGVSENSFMLNGQYEQHMLRCESLYEDMLADGIAPEQARMVLPQSMLTTYWVTGSLYAWANAFIQRSDAHAQLEIQGLASQWDSIIRPLFPVSWSALVD